MVRKAANKAKGNSTRRNQLDFFLVNITFLTLLNCFDNLFFELNVHNALFIVLLRKFARVFGAIMSLRLKAISYTDYLPHYFTLICLISRAYIVPT